MARWSAALAILLVLSAAVGAQEDPRASTLQRAQEDARIGALMRRIYLRPEDALIDVSETYDDKTAARFMGQAFASFPLRSATPYEILGGAILQRMAGDRYEAALAEYRHLLQDDDPKLLHRSLQEPRGTDGLTSRDSQALGHELLARLPPSVRDRYLQRIAADAAKLLADGEAKRDSLALRRLVREYRSSPFANKGLALLGDLAFENGEFEQALHWWRRLVPLPSQELINRRAHAPTRPEGVDAARIHAKQALALIFAGRPDAGRECDAFRTIFPTERGSLAGRTDAYHAILAHWREALKSIKPETDADWPTFAGSPSRNRTLPQAPSTRLWIDGPAWETPLPAVSLKEPPAVTLSATRSLATPPTLFHPIVVDGQVLISDGQSVRSYDLLTGKPLFREPAAPANPPELGEEERAVSGMAYCLSAAEGRAFARLGNHPGDARPGKLYCLDLAKPRIDAPRAPRVLWSIDAEADGKVAYFDTDPLVVGGRVYVGSLRVEERKSIRSLLCFDLNGVLHWQTKLAEIEVYDDRRIPRHGLLVGNDATILCATNAGALVAVDPLSGRRQWAFRSASLDVATSPRGVSSCLIADGRVFLAPADSPNLYCLDAETGRALWERPWGKPPSDIIGGPPAASEIVDLLGVVAGRLIFTDRFRLQALDAATGSTLEWQQPSFGKLPAHGRGLLAGPWVLWPTADPEISWRAVTHSEGALRDHDASPPYYDATALRALPAGNVAFGQGCLVVAGVKNLVVFAPPAAQLPVLQHDPQTVSDPAKLFRLAIAQFDGGQTDVAKTTIDRLDRLVPLDDRAAWAEMVQERLHPTIPKVAATSAAPRASTTPILKKPHVPPQVPVAKLVPAWGPIAGVAPPVEIVPGTTDDDTVVVLDGPEIAFIDMRTGDELFRRVRRAANVDWLGRSAADVVVAGRDGIEAFDLKLRRATWRFDAPALKVSHWQLVDGRPRRITGPERLGRFQFVHGFVTCFEERHQAFALDPKSGTIVAASPGDSIRSLTANTVLQPSIANFGRALPPQPEAASFAAWRSDSEEINATEARRRLVMLPDGRQFSGEKRGTIKLWKPSASLESATEVYQPVWPSSLTGGAAHVMGDGSLLLALVPRNYGFELIRFDSDSLRQMWSVAATELRDGFDVLAATWDESTLYFVQAGQLQARDLANGALLWKKTLPDGAGPWKVERFAGSLLVWPQSAAGVPALSGPVDPFSAAIALAHGRRGLGAVPILIIDAKDGSIKQRFDVPHDGGPVFANVHGPRLIVSAGGQVRAWSAVP